MDRSGEVLSIIDMSNEAGRRIVLDCFLNDILTQQGVPGILKVFLEMEASRVVDNVRNC